MTSPLWIGLPYVKLNYSQRLNNGKAFLGQPASVAEQVIELVGADTRLRASIAGPEVRVSSFLEMNFHGLRFNDEMRLAEVSDKAVALALVGDSGNSLDYLTFYLSSLRPGFTSDYVVQLTRLQDLLLKDLEYLEHIDLMEKSTIRILGITGSV